MRHISKETTDSGKNLFDLAKMLIIRETSSACPLMLCRLRYILVLFVILSGSAFVCAQDFLPELVKRIKPSAVAIETFDSHGNTLSRGSGFFVAADRIITNRHVIDRSSRVEVHLVDGKKFPVISSASWDMKCRTPPAAKSARSITSGSIRPVSPPSSV